MAKIPRLDAGNRPSSVTGGALPSATSVAAPFESAGNLAEIGSKIATDQEHEQALKIRQGKEAIQAVDNETEATKQVSGYNENALRVVEDVKNNSAPDPQAAPEKLRNQLQLALDEQIKAAKQINTAVALDVARQGGALNKELVNKMHVWSTAAQVQKIKVSVDASVNRAAANAASQPNLVLLDQYIKKQEATLDNQGKLAFGSSWDERKIAFRAEATQSWYHTYMWVDPLGAIKSLGAPSGPAADYLKDHQRNAIEADAAAVYEGRGAEATAKQAADSVSGNIDIYKTMLDNTFNGPMILAFRRRDIEERRKIIADKTYGPEQQKEQLDRLTQRDKFLENATKIYQKKLPAFVGDSPDVIAAESELLTEWKGLFKANRGKEGKSNLDRVLAFQTKLAAMTLDKKVGSARFDTLMRDVSLSLESAAAEGTKDTWSWGLSAKPKFWEKQSPKQSGTEELNHLLDNSIYRDLPPAAKMEARFNYIQRFTRELEEKRTPTHASAEELARESVKYAKAGVTK